MKRRALIRSNLSTRWAVAAFGAALLLAPAVSQAQDQPASAAPGPAEAAPAQPAQPTPPPRSYPPPPPRHPNAPGAWQQQQPGWQQPGVNQSNQWPYYPAQQIDGIHRPFSFTLAVGPGALIGPGERELALSYNLFRLGFGVVPNLQVILAFEGTGTNSVNPETNRDSWLKQENWLLGLQYYVVPRLYVRGAIGAGFVSEHTRFESFSGGTGIAMSGGIGFEFVQTRHVALAIDANGSITKYSEESWGTAGLNLAVSFF